MIDQLSKIIFSLIRCELKDDAVDENIKSLCQSWDILSKVYSISKNHDISHLVASALMKNKIISADDNDQFQEQMMMSVYRYEQTKYSFENIQILLKRAEIPYVPLKGAVIHKLYPSPWLRTSCDIDILIRKEDTDRAIEILIQNGYLKQNDTTAHDHSFISPNQVNFELHYSLDQGDQLTKANTILGNVWENCSPDPENECCYVMDRDMLVFYHIAHMANHFIHGGCGIRPFIDLWLLDKNQYCDSSRLRDLLKESGLSKFYDGAMNLVNVWFERHKHNDLTREMEKFIITGGAYGSISNSAAVKAAKGESRIKSFSNLMFLPRSSLEIIYPKLQKKPSLLPYYQVQRWFRLLDPQKRKQILTLTAKRNSVSKSTAQRVEYLLKRLNIER